MRHALLALLLVCAPAAAADDPKATIEKAAKAAGYSADDPPNQTWKDKGAIEVGGMKLEYAGTWVVQLPDKYKFDIAADFGGMKVQIVFGINGDKAWQSAMADFDPNAPMPADVQAACDFYEQLAKELTESGEFVTTEGLADPTHTKTIRKRAQGGPEVTDGPYAESKEYLGGFWIIEAPDLDAAIEYAKLGSKALQGRIEVRPFQEAPPQGESSVGA